MLSSVYSTSLMNPSMGQSFTEAGFFLVEQLPFARAADARSGKARSGV